MEFRILATDGRARAGELITDHGVVPTPTITLNYTRALEKWGFKPEDITTARDVILLRNTFWMREAGATDVREGVDWPGPVMADSGGFQMVSLGRHVRQTLRGIGLAVKGKQSFITPREVVEWGRGANVDLIMPLDNTVYTMDKNPLKFVWSAIMTAVWFKRSRGIADDKLYYIVQGGLNKLARQISLWDARRQLRGKILTANGGTPQNAVAAVAIGGLAWDEPRSAMYKMVEFCVSRLPDDKPRHLLGVCKPIDILECIERGIDSFDGIAATREGRHGRVWLWGGQYFDINNARYATDKTGLDSQCNCPVCRSGVSRADIRARFKAGDREVMRQLMAHNWHQNYRLISTARQAILEGRFQELKTSWRG
ncbi:TPA: hypothetical protein DHW58_01295 [Patescibacteria group bacterium]|uniref:Queuine tRNA-ribosyltransferase n=2 Tax=Bacteria division Kazan-3B-28 TaxID=1798534 RepID=A0A0G1X7F7_UNCK3|nr:MAG: tgt, queuine tRNA-ribosyltransferase [candidate division Kazan bacterium GW2011_GWA1_50_15]KKW25631.1 MAG: Queuine tRNA-ribosyltransferase [candidate division Kazan bacterium GW2011_GWC1_52_13]KKW26936.1 MAG: Queuine tRNA-ribosyltransferase [candidate division Kazan bacterium GW2011_GWB1_52_7]HAV66075.1 hypothetical protein [Patescibacteria group bacterium]HCL47606.1 hypothetical protein [Patescibacteria group bacterium]